MSVNFFYWTPFKSCHAISGGNKEKQFKIHNPEHYFSIWNLLGIWKIIFSSPLNHWGLCFKDFIPFYNIIFQSRKVKHLHKQTKVLEVIVNSKILKWLNIEMKCIYWFHFKIKQKSLFCLLSEYFFHLPLLSCRHFTLVGKWLTRVKWCFDTNTEWDHNLWQDLVLDCTLYNSKQIPL